MQIIEIAQAFLENAIVKEIAPIGGGNINKSFIVKSSIGNFILQRVNTDVFNDPFSMMKNAIKICEHLKRKNITTLVFVKKNIDDEISDQYLLFDKDTQSFWRCMKYIINSVCIDYAENCKYAKLTGYAFGKFINDCSDLTEELIPTIPDFHNLPKRIDKLKILHDEKLVKNSSPVTKAENEYQKLSELLERINCKLRNDLPDKITHNDTKIANLLFTDNEIIVIDLDTVMQGKITDDFGDSARSVASTVSEDETNLSKIQFDIKKFKSFTNGFATGINHILTEVEINALSSAPACVTAELACRFLTDYYAGNIYFKTLYPEHNLDRAINQTTLLEDILHKQVRINEIIYENFN